jgi:hypothetical protein
MPGYAPSEEVSDGSTFEARVRSRCNERYLTNSVK